MKLKINFKDGDVTYGLINGLRINEKIVSVEEKFKGKTFEFETSEISIIVLDGEVIYENK